MKEPQLTPLDPDVKSRLMEIVGEKNALTSEEAIAPYISEWRGRYGGKSGLVLRPGNTQEVSSILQVASKSKTAIVPQGGNTGLVGGQMPFSSGNEVILSLSRLNKIRNIDPLNNTITVEAGSILENIQKAAQEHDRLFPLSLGSEGSCQIGGNLSTNAGGTNVLKYGSTRDLTLGLEVVLADGQIWDGLNRLRKNNTGYDLRDLFIGAEGTLGIITAAVLKLFPRPKDISTSLIALQTPHQAIELLHIAEDISGGLVSGFELLPRTGLEFVLKHVSTAKDPLETVSPWYVLMELSGGSEADSLKQTAEKILEASLETGLITDATIAGSVKQGDDFWGLRLSMSEVQKRVGASIKNDVSVPISAIDQFITKADMAVEKAIPGCRPVPFGHLGDGNIHYNISQPPGMDADAFLSRDGEVHKLIHDLVMGLGGSVSAEHGIGKMKSHLMTEIKSQTELNMMRQIKSVLDPDNILNPGKLLP